MPHDPEAFAELVVLTIKSALAPITERLAVAEQANRDLSARVVELSGLRDRLTTMETKAAMVTPLEPPVVDLGPVLERVDGLDARLALLGDVPSRVDVVEGQLRGSVDGFSARVTDVEKRLSVFEVRDNFKGAEAGMLTTALTDLSKDIGAMRERVAVMEVRGQVAGPAGKDGKDGADGIGFDDLAVVQEDDRTVVFRGTKGHIVRDYGRFVVPAGIYRGVFIDGQTYERGDEVTWGGSQWHCNEATGAKPGEGSKAWTLQVKRGRDGKDGRDGRDPVPVVKA